jgi:hypothetical protein
MVYTCNIYMSYCSHINDVYMSYTCMIMQYVWYMFPINASKRDRYNRCAEDIPLDLVFFSAFEDLRL